MPGVVDLAYGRGSITVPLVGWEPMVVVPHDDPPLADPPGAIAAAIASPLGAPPLGELVAGVKEVVISVCDGTRALPRRAMLPPILDAIDAAAPGARVTVLIATGTHRGNTPVELEEMFGTDLLRRVEVVNHDARDQASLVALGTVAGDVPVEVNRRWVEADVRITTGFVEPHFFAGFSGGPKMVVPGLAGLATVMALHNASRIGNSTATWGPVADNAVHRDIRAATALAPPALAVDVLLDRFKTITHVFAGELGVMHAAACAQALEAAMCPVPDPFDVVVTTGSGFPLDQNLYQAVKGMSAAERIVRPGGTIVIAAACEDGLPYHGSFAEVLGSAATPVELLDLISSEGFAVPDQWQVQILARILAKARVQLYCDGLTPEQVRAAHVEPIGNLAAAIETAAAEAGPGARVCYLPEGPQTIPYLTE